MTTNSNSSDLAYASGMSGAARHVPTVGRPILLHSPTRDNLKRKFLRMPSGEEYFVQHEAQSEFARHFHVYTRDGAEHYHLKTPRIDSLGCQEHSVRHLQHEHAIVTELHAANVAGVMPIEGKEETQEGPWLKLPYLGTDLSACASVQSAAQIAASLSTIVADCNAAGTIHRDVKPHNVYWRNGAVVLGDFGIAKSNRYSLPIKQDVVWGTPLFMAPEAMEGKQYSDAYSVGATLFTLASGNPLVTEMYLKTMLVQKRRKEYASLSLSRDMQWQYEPFLDTVYALCEPDPELRLSLRKAAEQFKDFAATMDVAREPPSSIIEKWRFAWKLRLRTY